METLITVPEAARTLRLSTTRVWQLVWSGELPSVHIGRSVRITPEALRAFVERRSS